MKRLLPYTLPIFRSVIFIVGGLIFAILTHQSLEQASRWWSVLCSLFNVATIFVLMVVCKIEGITYASFMNNQKERLSIKMILGTVLLMLLIGIGGMLAFGLVFYGSVPTILIQPIPVWIALINTVVLPITIVLAEMPLYFGYAYNKIEEHTGNKYFAFGYTIFFYALQHSFIPLLLNWRYMAYRFLSFLPLMLVLGILYDRRRKLSTLMIGHGVMDLATGVQIVIASIWPTLF